MSDLPSADRSWIPSVEDGQCHQQQGDGSWISCKCWPGEPCGYDGGEQHEGKPRPVKRGW